LNQTPVIVVSADIQSSTQEACQALGIIGFVNKPFKAAGVNELLAKVFDQSQSAAA